MLLVWGAGLKVDLTYQRMRCATCRELLQRGQTATFGSEFIWEHKECWEKRVGK